MAQARLGRETEHFQYRAQRLLLVVKESPVAQGQIGAPSLGFSAGTTRRDLASGGRVNAVGIRSRIEGLPTSPRAGRMAVSTLRKRS
jgi:hypothetical protein